MRRPRSDARFSAAWFEQIGRYADLDPLVFATLLHGRRSPLMPRPRPAIYCRLLTTTEKAAPLRALRGQLVSGAKWIYGRPAPRSPDDGPRLSRSPD